MDDINSEISLGEAARLCLKWTLAALPSIGLLVVLYMALVYFVMSMGMNQLQSFQAHQVMNPPGPTLVK